jgi:hypothetical protein
MSAEGDGSVTRWIGDLKAGVDTAAQPLWERYFAVLILLARTLTRARRIARGRG